MRLLLICATLLAFQLQAAAYNSCNSACQPVTACSQDPESPDVDLFRNKVPVMSVSAEFLYWTINEGALDYALKMTSSAFDPTGVNFAQGHFKCANYQLDPGFRIGLLYYRAPRFWEVKGQYTRLTCRGENNSGKPSTDTKFLTGTWPQIFTQPMAGAKSHIHMNYNVFDFLVDRYFMPNPHLRLRVVGGGAVAWMDQYWKIQYNDSSLNETTIQNRWKFVGGGLKTGTMVDWFWTKNIYITGLTTFGVLVGSYENRSLQTTNFEPTATANTALPLRNAFLQDTRGVFTVQFIFGPSWQKNYTCNRVEIFAGYEVNAWFNLQEIYRSTSGTAFAAKETLINTSTMILQGLTTRLTVDF